MSNIIDLLTVTPLSKGGTIKILDEDGVELDDSEFVNTIGKKLYKKYKVKEILEKALKYSFIYGGCLLFLDYDQTYLESPLD